VPIGSVGGPAPGTLGLHQVFVRINGELHYLWRALDQHRIVLAILVQAGEMPQQPSASYTVPFGSGHEIWARFARCPDLARRRSSWQCPHAIWSHFAKGSMLG
jgi:hypothetical protein